MIVFKGTVQPEKKGVKEKIDSKLTFLTSWLKRIFCVILKGPDPSKCKILVYCCIILVWPVLPETFWKGDPIQYSLLVCTNKLPATYAMHLQRQGEHRYQICIKYFFLFLCSLLV